MRLSLFLLVLIGSPIIPLVALVLGGWYALRYRGYELLLATLLIDGYFGQILVAPWYTLGCIAWLAVAEYIKPRLTWYRD